MYVCVCVCVCVRVCVCVCVIQDVSKTKNLVSLERVAGDHQKATESAHRQHIKNLTLSGVWFKEENPCGSKCSRNGTLCYVNVVKDMYYNIIPEQLPIQI